MTSQHEHAAYYRAVEEAFVRRRGAAMLLSPRDWSLIGEWIDVGVPLRVVLQAIDNIFDAFETGQGERLWAHRHQPRIQQLRQLR